eukprot:COSAG06_NODE_68980_length_199_cov_78.100000_1_plen_61_part_01
MQPTFSWDGWCGKDASLLLNCGEKYDFDSDHVFAVETFACEAFHIYGGSWIPLAVHFGQLE